MKSDKSVSIYAVVAGLVIWLAANTFFVLFGEAVVPESRAAAAIFLIAFALLAALAGVGATAIPALLGKASAYIPEMSQRIALGLVLVGVTGDGIIMMIWDGGYPRLSDRQFDVFVTSLFVAYGLMGVGALAGRYFVPASAQRSIPDRT
ncbi:hypothetical protein [Gordonia jacobaea]|uniref:hypothetical protein n=1 Tax=Gordonia jacobaea TaxID=122202 RepID=UPI003D74A51E